MRGAAPLTESTNLTLLTYAERALATIAQADEAAKLADLAEAARVYARKAELGTAAVNHATVIKARALKRMAELVDEGQQRGEIATPGGDGSNQHRANVPPQDNCSPATLTDLGIARQRLHEARKLATRPQAQGRDAARGGRRGAATRRDCARKRHTQARSRCPGTGQRGRAGTREPHRSWDYPAAPARGAQSARDGARPTFPKRLTMAVPKGTKVRQR